MIFRILALFFLVFAFANEAYAFGRCTDTGYLRGFDSRLGPTSCRVIHTTEIRWRGGSAAVRVIVAGGPTPALNADERNFITRVDALAERVGDAMDAFGGLQLHDTSILLSNLTRGSFHAGTFGGSDECKIVFYKTGDAVSLNRFLFTYSHEIFHCAQEATWPALYAMPGTEDNWWMEGTAEYFAHVANPNSSEGDSFINQFDADSPTDTLVDMDYAAVVFFLWLGNEREPRGVRAFIDGMARTGGRSAQLAALRARMPLERWIAFGQKYLDGRIRQPGGRALPSLVDRGETVIFQRPARHQSATSEYVLTRETFVFKKGRTYRLSRTDVSGTLQSKFGLTPGNWADPPTRVLACDADKRYTVLTASVQGDTSSHTFVMADSEVVNERACCLIGDWVPTEASKQSEAALMQGMGGPPIAAHGASFTCGYNGGSWVLSFAPDSTGTVTWNGFSNRCVTRAPRGSMTGTTTRRGATRFTWQIREPGAGMANYTGNTLAYTYVMSIGPKNITNTFPDSGPRHANGFAYQCSANNLTIHGIYGVNYGQAAYTKSETSISP